MKTGTDECAEDIVNFFGCFNTAANFCMGDA